MSSSPQAPESAQCPICGALVAPAEAFCGACGSKLTDTPALKVRSLNFLLSELSRWELMGLISLEQATALRASYEEQREMLRAQLAASRKRSAPPQEKKTTSQETETPPRAPDEPLRQPTPPAFTQGAGESRERRRALLETLADPHTIRLLLYTGAAMLVVGVVIWLRDILYLKLQEPIVQATLLIIGTIVFTVSGWWTILRTRLRLTGRALTITGSLLVPVNFWFLVRSGLIESSGSSWFVCAFCAVLYGLTASFLRERLYVYMASVAAVATIWTLIYRMEREAFGLYALSLMAASLLFLHLSRLFTEEGDDARPTVGNQQSAISNPQSLSNYELWGPPLIYVALAGIVLCLFFYMPLRLGAEPSFRDGLLHLRAGQYDSATAMLLFAAGAYGLWLTGRRIFTGRSRALYTASALCLFWTEFLALDGFNLSASTTLLLLALTTLIVSIAVRSVKDDAYSFAIHRASLIANVMLTPFAFALLYGDTAPVITHSLILALLAASYAALSAPRISGRIVAATLAYASAILISISFLVALSSLNLQSDTLFYALCALWPFTLYAVALLTARLRREPQLSEPFVRVADGAYVLLLLFAVICAFALNQATEERFLEVEHLRGAVLSVLAAAILYGALRAQRDRSFFGAAIIPVALLMEALIILRVDAAWYATALVLTLFPVFFVVSRYALARGINWLAAPSGVAASAVLALAAIASVAQALIHLRIGDPLLLAPSVAFGAVALLSFGASLRARSEERLGYFRAGLFTLILAFSLAALRAGYDPLGDVEIYTSPTALLLLAVAYLFARRRRDEYAGDTSLLLWIGSLLLAGPLLLHALQYRLFLDVPAPWRDLLTLCASLALVIFGVLGRLRAPVLVGASSLMLELAALAMTSVNWLQIPLKVYLISTGALILLIWGLLEFRREQLLVMRRRFQERRETARERFGEWK